MSKSKTNKRKPDDENEHENLSTENDDIALPIDKIEAMFTRLIMIINNSFSITMNKTVDAIEHKLTGRLDSQSAEIFSLHQRLDKADKQITELNNEISNLKTANRTLDSKISNRSSEPDEYTYVDNLLIHGLPQTATDNNLEQQVIDLIKNNLTGIDISESDISIAHRIGRPQNRTSQENARPQATIVRFCRRSLRNKILQSRRLLKGKHISITEHLPPYKTALLTKGNELVASNKLSSSWSSGGRILIKTLQNDIVHISSLVQLDQY